MIKETVKTKIGPKVQLNNRWHNVEYDSVKIYLIYTHKINSVGELADNENLWPKRASNYFQKEKKRLAFQANHELLVRMHTMALVLNKKKQ